MEQGLSAELTALGFHCFTTRVAGEGVCVAVCVAVAHTLLLWLSVALRVREREVLLQGVEVALGLAESGVEQSGPL
jgi:hypothetical protein